MSRSFLIYVIVLSLVMPPFARVARAEANACEACGSEYSIGDLPKSVLIRVRLIGAVGKAGMFNVPRGMDLMTLLTAAGGLSNQANGEVVIKRRQGKVFVVSEYDLSDMVGDEEQQFPELKSDDVIYASFRRPLVGDNTLQVLALISSLLGIALTSLVLSNQL